MTSINDRSKKIMVLLISYQNCLRKNYKNICDAFQADLQPNLFEEHFSLPERTISFKKKWQNPIYTSFYVRRIPNGEIFWDSIPRVHSKIGCEIHKNTYSGIKNQIIKLKTLFTIQRKNYRNHSKHIFYASGTIKPDLFCTQISNMDKISSENSEKINSDNIGLGKACMKNNQRNSVKKNSIPMCSIRIRRNTTNILKIITLVYFAATHAKIPLHAADSGRNTQVNYQNSEGKSQNNPSHLGFSAPSTGTISNSKKSTSSQGITKKQSHKGMVANTSGTLSENKSGNPSGSGISSDRLAANPSGQIPSGLLGGSKIQPISVQANQAYLIDLSTHAVLLEKNADQSMAPSSMTKIVTVYVMLQALAQKTLDWTEKLYVSDNAAKKPGSRMFIKAGEMIPVIDLLKGIVVTSGNDACTVVAEFLGGSEEGFADMMNTVAAQCGMRDSHFVNASGLPAENHYSTCKDLAKIAEKTLIDFPKEYAQFYKMTSFKYNGIAQPNRNGLLKNGFADGMKTGMTDAGKYGIVASAKRPGYPERRLLLVLNGVASSNLRAAEARRLLNWGFQRFESFFVEKDRFIVNLPLWKEGSVALVTASPLAITLPKGSLRSAKIVARYYQPLTPPIQKNQVLGKLCIEISGQSPIEIPLVAQKEVRSPNLWDWFVGLFSKKS